MSTNIEYVAQACCSVRQAERLVTAIENGVVTIPNTDISLPLKPDQIEDLKDLYMDEKEKVFDAMNNVEFE